MTSSIRLAAAAIALGLTGCALEPGRIEGPNWDGPREFWADDPTPTAAAMNGVSGWAVLRCRATATMHLTDCLPIAEAPPRWGFGQAALKMAPQLAVREGSPDHGYALPSPGEYAIIPIFFCPPQVAEACRTAGRQQAALFSSKASKVIDLMDGGRCAEAEPAAAALGQPLFTALVEQTCRQRAGG